jgi:hypothetical protein
MKNNMLKLLTSISTLCVIAEAISLRNYAVHSDKKEARQLFAGILVAGEAAAEFTEVIEAAFDVGAEFAPTAAEQAAGDVEMVTFQTDAEVTTGATGNLATYPANNVGALYSNVAPLNIATTINEAEAYTINEGEVLLTGTQELTAQQQFYQLLDNSRFQFSSTAATAMATFIGSAILSGVATSAYFNGNNVFYCGGTTPVKTFGDYTYKFWFQFFNTTTDDNCKLLNVDYAELEKRAYKAMVASQSSFGTCIRVATSKKSYVYISILRLDSPLTVYDVPCALKLGV